MSSDVVLVRGARTAVTTALRLVASVDDAAERLEGAAEHARVLLRRLPVPRGPEAH